MFKFVVVLSLAALAAANPGVVVPAVHTAVVPGVSSVSAYDTRIVHPSPVYTVPIAHASPIWYGNGYHRLHKRSLAAVPVSYSSIVGPSTLGNPWSLWGGYGAGYGTGYGLGAWNTLGLGYAAGYPRALSVHPY